MAIFIPVIIFDLPSKISTPPSFIPFQIWLVFIGGDDKLEPIFIHSLRDELTKVASHGMRPVLYPQETPQREMEERVVVIQLQWGS